VTDRSEKRCAFSDLKVWFVQFYLLSGVNLNIKVLR
jgi:hypothetical protein